MLHVRLAMTLIRTHNNLHLLKKNTKYEHNMTKNTKPTMLTADSRTGCYSTERQTLCACAVLTLLLRGFTAACTHYIALPPPRDGKRKAS